MRCSSSFRPQGVDKTSDADGTRPACHGDLSVGICDASLWSISLFQEHAGYRNNKIASAPRVGRYDQLPARNAFLTYRPPHLPSNVETLNVSESFILEQVADAHDFQEWIRSTHPSDNTKLLLNTYGTCFARYQYGRQVRHTCKGNQCEGSNGDSTYLFHPRAQRDLQIRYESPAL